MKGFFSLMYSFSFSFLKTSFSKKTSQIHSGFLQAKILSPSIQHTSQVKAKYHIIPNLLNFLGTFTSLRKSQDHIVKMGILTALDKQFVLRNLNYTSLSGLLQKGKVL